MGRVGYMLEDRVSPVEEFLGTLERVVASGTVLDPEPVTELLTLRRGTLVDTLTPREREVLKLRCRASTTARSPPRWSSPNAP
ncbi:hypothetical protein CTZ28_40445 [Streptomyces shenzhenensis]|uniref:HTH luxR-type domain-containing protein n=1 Tax=Streptomyces shenzhenensis TaxID=943815 RepID=A0A3M0I0X0_9ACTN|nr:hypothetical protein CTZ28_40445 [Streptomyces shenzhenensis]